MEAVKYFEKDIKRLANYLTEQQLADLEEALLALPPELNLKLPIAEDLLDLFKDASKQKVPELADQVIAFIKEYAESPRIIFQTFGMLANAMDEKSHSDTATEKAIRVLENLKINKAAFANLNEKAKIALIKSKVLDEFKSIKEF